MNSFCLSFCYPNEFLYSTCIIDGISFRLSIVFSWESIRPLLCDKIESASEGPIGKFLRERETWRLHFLLFDLSSRVLFHSKVENPFVTDGTRLLLKLSETERWKTITMYLMRIDLELSLWNRQASLNHWFTLKVNSLLSIKLHMITIRQLLKQCLSLRDGCSVSCLLQSFIWNSAFTVIITFVC